MGTHVEVQLRRHKTSGLGLPSFEYADRVTSQEAARNCFFKAITSVAPEVLRDLARKPWREFQRIDEPLPRQHNLLEEIRVGWTGAAVWPPVPWNVSAELDHELTAWQQKHCLTDSWCRERALWTLARWRPERKLRGKDWEYPDPQPTLHVGGAGFVAPAFQLCILGWDPLDERWESWLEREDILGKLRAYQQRVTEAVEQAGFLRTPTKRELDHFEWLARYQVKGEDFKQIRADFTHVNTNGAVKMAVHRLASAIGLTLRTGQANPSVPERKERTSPKRGRPLGSKDAKLSRHRVR